MSFKLEQVSSVVGGNTHIYPLDLTLTAGSLNVLLGPTQAGKTSLMRLMAGLDKPTTGDISWNGDRMNDVPVQKRNIAMVYQQFINYPAMTVYENIASPLRIRGLSNKAIDKKVMEASELMKLTPMLQRKPLELSGGQQQRCALARALVKDADLVLLDEPLANLDYKLREELREEMPKIFTESGAVFVYATTEPTEALLLGGNTVAMSEGRIAQFGKTLDVYRNPKDMTTARVFSEPPMNFLKITKQGGELHVQGEQTRTATGAFTTLDNGQYTVGIRPNHLMLHRPSDDALAIEVTVSVVEITGSESFVHLLHGDQRWVSLAHGIHHPESGSTLTVYVDPSNAYIFDENEQMVRAPELAKVA
ncbi:ABC transporter ATP-binding protein [Leucothrix arctica]|uniref:ABC transporter ATP-binding protein n=1 Tax=Leucothrix arctica TaxID=1481894 RepID=A0A317CFV1_9GAMM|nr:ABC transporter ATP-binding protein [Leucothrix arctica]PWQ96273.1 ABC transporter ATP-binding protein [Leucothrix arctica]